LPKNPDLRPTLRVKDDDYRLSFMDGCYITLSNVTHQDLDRIKRLKLSPLYISVHSTDPNLRGKLMGFNNPKPILPTLQDLAANGIKLHTQIVYCPGYNEDIENSARALALISESLAVVPVGLTRYHNRHLLPVTADDASRIIAIVEKLQVEFLAQKDSRFIWAADEFYIKAGKAMPASCSYESYCQIENGVGLFAKFEEDFDFTLEDILEDKANKKLLKQLALPKKPSDSLKPIKHYSIATASSSHAFINQKAAQLSSQFNIKLEVFEVENLFFGSSVTVSGLLTGGCIATALKDKRLGDALLLPDVTLRDGTEDFLDNMTVPQLSAQLSVPVIATGSDGESFVRTILGLNV